MVEELQMKLVARFIDYKVSKMGKQKDCKWEVHVVYEVRGEKIFQVRKVATKSIQSKRLP